MSTDTYTNWRTSSCPRVPEPGTEHPTEQPCLISVVQNENPHTLYQNPTNPPKCTKNPLEMYTRPPFVGECLPGARPARYF